MYTNPSSNFNNDTKLMASLRNKTIYSSLGLANREKLGTSNNSTAHKILRERRCASTGGYYKNDNDNFQFTN